MKIRSTTFAPGHVKLGGRRKGTPNISSAEVRAYCAQILSRIKMDKLIHDLFLDANGEHKQLTEVSSRVLIRLMEYGWGQPRQEMDVTVNMRDAIQSARQRVIEAQVIEIPQLEGKSLPAETTPHPRIDNVTPGEERGPILANGDLIDKNGRLISAAARERIREGQRKRRENELKRAVAKGKSECDLQGGKSG